MSNRNRTAPLRTLPGAWAALESCTTLIYWDTYKPTLIADLGLKAFYSDFSIPMGKMGQTPLKVLPRAQGYAEAHYPSFFSFGTPPCCPSPLLYSQRAAHKMPGRTSQRLLLHTEAKHHYQLQGVRARSKWQLMAEPCPSQGNPSWLLLSSDSIFTSSCLPWNTAC